MGTHSFDSLHDLCKLRNVQNVFSSIFLHFLYINCTRCNLHKCFSYFTQFAKTPSFFYSNNEKVLKASKGGAKGMVEREKKVRGVGKVEIVGNLKHLHIITFEEAAVKWAKHTRQSRV